jgi:cation-transporting ATPase 13A1
VIKGVTGLNLDQKSSINELVNLNEVHVQDRRALTVLAGCHTLAVADNQLVGDPIEKQAFEGIGYKHDGRKTSYHQGNQGPKILQIKRFLFESALKRMSSIVQTEDSKSSGTEFKVLSKGAPEVIKKFLRTVPSNYDQCYLKHVKNGARVLALAYKTLNRAPIEQLTAIKREEAESDLTFCGFIVSECPLKPDTARVITELKDSRHMVKMITGDNQLTAAYIGKELKFGSTDSSLFASASVDSLISWFDQDDKLVSKTSSAAEVHALALKHQLCINGDTLDVISTSKEISTIVKAIHVFSRTSPNQKDFIVGMLNKEGHVTMMCGDGTNDVGSLKRANIGLAIVNNKDPSKADKTKRKTMSMWLKPADLQGLNPQQAREKQ